LTLRIVLQAVRNWCRCAIDERQTLKISDRFTDYGLIGGFFWLLQCSLLGIVFWPMPGWDPLLPAVCKDLIALPPSAYPVLAALLGALALIVIFTTGLLLDLLGSSYFRVVEANIFIAHLRRNKRWMERLMKENGDYIQDDWLQLLGTSPDWSKARISVWFKVLMFWNSGYRREFVSESWGLREPYTRIQSFLLIYVLVAAGVEKIELLSAQINLWNTGRAIAAGAMFGSLLGVVVIIFTHSFMFAAAQMCLMIIALAIISSAYARVCSTLFALTYVVASRTPATVITTAVE